MKSLVTAIGTFAVISWSFWVVFDAGVKHGTTRQRIHDEDLAVTCDMRCENAIVDQRVCAAMPQKGK